MHPTRPNVTTPERSSKVDEIYRLFYYPKCERYEGVDRGLIAPSSQVSGDNDNDSFHSSGLCVIPAPFNWL
jgi:hypothetical protein